MKLMTIKIVIYILFACILSLYGCGKAELGMNTNINENESGEIKFTATLTGIFAQQSDSLTGSEDSSQGILSAFNLEDKNVTTETKEENGIKTTTVTYPFKNLDELNSLLKSSEGNEFYMNIEKKESFFKTQYIYTMKLPSNFNMDAMMSEIKNNQSEGDTPLIEENTISSFIGSSISVKNNLTTPGKLISSNATKTEQNTLTWEYTLLQLKTGETFTATYKVANKTNIAVAVGGGILILLVGSGLIIRRKRVPHT